jgi:CIC family chloride channel protein
LGAVVLIKAIDIVGAISSGLGESLSLGRFWPVLTLPIGIWISWRLTSWFAPEAAGHGVPQIIAAIAVRGGNVRARLMLVKTVATGVTIGSGGSAGREGSIAQIGSSIGAWLGRVARLREDDVRVLVAAGAGAGISATFNAPIAGMLFAMEVILQEFALRHVHTIVVASVVGAVVSRTVIGDDLTFEVSPYALDDPRQLVLFAILGLAAVASAWLFLTALDWFELAPERLPSWIRPLILGGAVAVLGLIRPEVLGTGQAFVGSILRNEAGLAWWTLGLLAVFKAIATSATLGGRGAGGIFMPSLFIGATTGSGVAAVLSNVWRWSEIQAGAFALVGMAATFSAVARAPLTSILIVFEITGDYGLVLPLMIATVISTILAGRVHPESAYTASLTRMGIHPVHSGVTDLLDTVRVGDIVTDGSPARVDLASTLGEVEGVLIRSHLRGVPVISDGRLVGIVAQSDIVRAGGPSDQMTAADVMTPNPATVNPETRVSDALERMAALGIGRLPVVDANDPGRLIGVFRREDVIAAYHQALSVTARASTVPGRVGARTTGDAVFSEMTIPPGSVADGRPVSEIPWPEACLLVSVFRGTEQLVPSGMTVLHAGDAITVFGGREANRRLLERLTIGMEASGA